jgi:hypothetical protein
MLGTPALINGIRQDFNRSEAEARADRARRDARNLKVIPAARIDAAIELAESFGESHLRAVVIAVSVAGALERNGRARALEIATDHFFLCHARDLVSVLEGPPPAEASFGDECTCAGCR